MREVKKNLGDLMPMIEERLAAGYEVMFSPNGVSMLPTLCAGRDVAVLVSPPERLKKYDIALFRIGDRYVLHRVISVGDTYTFIGDNQFDCERNIAHADVIALCIACERDGRRVRLDSRAARTRARFWHLVRPLRRLGARIKSKLKFTFKK